MAERSASAAQAREIARLWGARRSISVGGYVDPTTAALVRRGWIVPDGTEGVYPSGATYIGHSVSAAGLDALCRFLMALKATAVAPAPETEGPSG